ncbi:MAG: cytochrome b/b6 domain-containing protein [Thiotrichales bacterium]|nr:MAG: cytochrome b/b6 domain-containing protein [Thiotrichales bacterium]
MSGENYVYPQYAKIMHAGMAIFGVTAFLSGELAEHGSNSPGYLVHAYLGLSLALFVALRVIAGAGSSGPMRFSGWSPFAPRQWKLAIEDVRTLGRLRVPERGMHEGLAGLTQAFGLVLFGWMGVTGTVLFVLSGGPGRTMFKILEELHEVGEALIPLYLALHVGSVFVHSLAGRPIWQKMWKFRVTVPEKTGLQ